MSQNGQDNKCPCSSQSKIIIYFAIAAHEYPNDVGDRVSADDSIIMASKPLDRIVGQPTTETIDRNMTEQTIVSFHPTPETESLAAFNRRSPITTYDRSDRNRTKDGVMHL